MKRIITSIFILIAAAVSAIAAEKPDTLKIMTYNLRFGELATMKEIGQYIASETPDIVALQECDWATARKRAPHQNGVKFVNELAYWVECSACMESQSIMQEAIMESACSAAILCCAVKEFCFPMTERLNKGACSLLI